MSSNSGVSVLIPAYNAEEYVENTLKSVFEQSYKDFEVIIVDDGSTDNTLKVLEAWKKYYPNQIRFQTQENCGVSETRNTLLSLATKKYLTFLDSDDYIDSDYLRTLINAAEIANSDMVISGQKKVSPEGDLISLIHYPVDRYPTTAMRRLNFAGKLYRRSFVEEIGIRFEKHNLYEDNPFNLALMTLARNLQILPYEGYNQIVHIGSITTRKITDDWIPFDAIEKTVRVIASRRHQVEDFDLFVYTLLSFFAFFIFKANRTHSYMKMNKSRTSNIETVLKFSEFVQKIIIKYEIPYKNNKYFKEANTKDLPLSQKLGVFVYVHLLKTGWVEKFIKLYYLL